MQAAIVAVLGYFLSMAEKSAALTETKIDDAFVAVAKKLVASQAFIDLLTGWLTPKADVHNAMPFPPTYQAAIARPDGHILRSIIDALHIDTATVEKVWAFLAPILISLFA